MNPHLLDSHAIQMALAGLYGQQNCTLVRRCDGNGDRPLPAWTFRIYNQLASTRRTLWLALRNGAPSHTVIIAHTQTQGKGQRGRSWVSHPGGLYLSAGIRWTSAATTPQQLTLAMAWGIATSLRSLGIGVGIKWPNDLVVGGKKLGGILMETRMRGDRLTWVGIGVGLNWMNPVPSTAVTLHSLLSSNPKIQSNAFTLNDLAALTLTGIDAGLHRCQHDRLEAIAADYETLLVNRGQQVTLPASAHPDEGNLPQIGVVAGVNTSGDLRVQKLSISSSGGFSNADSDADSPELIFSPGSLSLGYGSSPDDSKSLANFVDLSGDTVV